MFEVLTPSNVASAQWRLKLHGPAPAPNNLYFTKDWPKNAQTGWATDAYFQIAKTVIVPYRIGRKYVGNDYQNISLYNVVGSLTALQPNEQNVVYETLIGLKKGAYQVAIYVPGPNDYLLSLGQSNMYPQVGDPNLKFLGAFRPEDSPEDNPTLKLWTINQQAAWLLQIATDRGVDYEKPVLAFQVAKHRVTQLPGKPLVSTTIEYYTTEKGNW
jgi:hypothetical protein